MTKVKIQDIKERTRFLGPDKSEVTLDVTYETEKGFRGVVKGLPQKATEDEIWDAVRKAAEVPERMIGMEKEI